MSARDFCAMVNIQHTRKEENIQASCSLLLINTTSGCFLCIKYFQFGKQRCVVTNRILLSDVCVRYTLFYA